MLIVRGMPHHHEDGKATADAAQELLETGMSASVICGFFDALEMMKTASIN
ncbi:MAG: hypothetical protein ITG04_12835 [Proteiniphilum sp.]|jgi:hypothetical protein|nr:hypothetical protein [Proteiniphilum sp.]